jgi:hypothetical protein
VSGKICGGAGDDAELSRSSVGFRGGGMSREG